MRIILSMIFSSFFIMLKAQDPLALRNMSIMPGINYNYLNSPDNSINTHQKWFVSKYAGISTGMLFYNGGATSYFSAPVGIQLNRQINHNLYAFAGVSVAPTYYYMSNSFQNTRSGNMYPMNNMLSPNSLGIYSRMEMGLMYVNDQKTFSVSGSISIDRGSYPVYPSSGYTRKQPVTRQ
jgi:hypothetical protein